MRTYLEGEWIIGRPTIKQYRKAIRKVYAECSGAHRWSCTFIDGIYKVNLYRSKIREIQKQKTMDINSKRILANAIMKWGVKAQLMMALEETAELQKAICKFDRSKPEDEKQRIMDILDEVADVEIMCQQLRLMFDAEGEVVNRIKHEKIARLEHRLNKNEM